MKCDHKSTLMEIYLKFMLTPKLFSFTSWLHQQGVYIFTNWLRGLYHPIRELLVALALGNFFCISLIEVHAVITSCFCR